MNKTSIVPPPEIIIRSATDVQWADEVKAYYSMFDEMLAKYENKFVAIYQGRVVASGDGKTEVALSALDQFGSVPFFLHRVSTIVEKPKRMRMSLQYREIGKRKFLTEFDVLSHKGKE